MIGDTIIDRRTTVQMIWTVVSVHGSNVDYPTEITMERSVISSSGMRSSTIERVRYSRLTLQSAVSRLWVLR